ncbi:MAG: glycoside hydrolase family 2 protein, partial [Candidatus Cloacimonetes bacterium]|nr:glycoside hydrolase family 2 protein [Candidatus Cloacimonadota bacterium]
MASFMLIFSSCSNEKDLAGNILNFNKEWKFFLGDAPGASDPDYNDSEWRNLNLPHDWSIEGEFKADNPATPGGGALPGGIGWYRKNFTISGQDKDKLICIDFDGIYQNSEVWINGHYLGKRPYGYISFRYELTPYLKYDEEENVLAVKVDNSQQPNSRWYSGSGIYRNVWLVKTNKVFVDQWGTYVTTPRIDDQSALVSVLTKVKNVTPEAQTIRLKTEIADADGKIVTSSISDEEILNNNSKEILHEIEVENPVLWSIENPYLYKVITTIEYSENIGDQYETNFGIRYFNFDAQKGFSLNGKNMKLYGVCNHHDLGCLGTAVNTRALERQLEILKEMGCNSMRTSHNPPAPELLDLCDKMGFLVMDEAFDMWKKKKTDFDYHLYWDEWHVRDLQDFILRDRNHPSVLIWSIGNEIGEQWDTSGIRIAQELASIVRKLDSGRPITSGCNFPDPDNYIIRSGALDLVGYNYQQDHFAEFPQKFPGQKFIASETTSALATRGYYDMPSDSIRVWPSRWDKPAPANPDHTCSSYDNCHVPWGSTHEEAWVMIKKFDFLSGMYIWTGFDYLGEPTPYWWPARSSYFGIIDLAGFPKDSYYLYQSEWTDTPVLHIFPHWNWNKGDTIDVWAYTSCDEAELFLNGRSLGVRQKVEDVFHLVWRVPWETGELKAIGRKSGENVLEKSIKTAGEA